MAERLGHVVAVAGAQVSVRLQEGRADETGRNVAPQIHALVRIAAARSLVYGTIRELHVISNGTPESGRIAEVEVIGERLPAGDDYGPFHRGVSHFPSLGDEVRTAGQEDLREVFVPYDQENVRVGALTSDAGLPACVLSDDLLSKHFAVLGSTGSGKSCSVTVLLRAILDGHPNSHVILLDPHNEYASAFGNSAVVLSPETMSLPYWLLNFEEMVEMFCSPEPAAREAEADILRREILGAKEAYFGQRSPGYSVTVDTPVPYRLTTLLQNIDREMGRLNRPGDTLPYMRLKSRIETLRGDQRFAFMFGGLAVQDTMADIIAHLMRIPVNGQPITIVDLSAVPVEIVDAVVSVLCRMIFDFAVWAGEEDQVPVLLICEEAHRYIPQDASAAFAPARKGLSRIAKEGRKYGISLGLVTQRPSEMSETVLSQCSTLFALRMSNDRDQEFVRRALPEGAGAMFNALPALGEREAIAVGEGAAVPMRIRFDELAEGARPRSAAAEFSSAWAVDGGSRQFVAEVVDRWRRQARSRPGAERAPQSLVAG